MNPRDELTPDGPCGPFREDAYDFLDDDRPAGPDEPALLSAARRREIRRHIESCAPCAAHFRSAAALEAALPLWEAPRPAPGFLERVMDAARRDGVEAAPAPRRTVSPRPLLTMAAAAAVLVVAALSLSQFFSPGERPTGNSLATRTGGEPAYVSYSADVAAPAALTFVSGPDPAVVSRVLRTVSSQR